MLDFHVAEGDRVFLDLGATFIDLGAGDQVILVGVSMSSLLPSSIFLG